MPSFALEHRRKVLAEQDLQRKEQENQVSFTERSQNMRENNTTFTASLSALDVARQEVSNTPQGMQRNEKKRAYLADLFHAVQTYVNEGVSYANPLVSQLMIWAHDVGDISSVEYLSDICLKEKQDLPGGFGRTLETVVADFFMKYGENIKDKNERILFFKSKFEQIKNWYIHDAIKSKYCKFIGGAFFEMQQFEEALKWFNLCKEINPQANVKTVTEKCIKMLSKQDAFDPINGVFSP